MFPLSAHSRRVLVASAAALATARAVEAKKGKRKKKKPVPPLAFAVAQVDLVSFGLSTFTCSVSFGWIYPAGPFIGGFSTEIEVIFAAAEEQIRAEIVAKVRELVASDLASDGVAAPVERIAVTLL